MKSIDMYIQEIRHAVHKLQNKHNQYFDNQLLIAYRGEPCNYEKTKLMPSLFRESDYSKKEEHLFELFCDYKMISNGASNIEKAIEAQHYAAISRMLDITFNALVGLYFACDDNKQDGYVFVFAFPEHYSPHSNYIEKFYTNVLNGRYTAYSKNFKVFSHSYSNDRIKAQKGGFIFFPGEEFFSINNCYYSTVKIYKDDKMQLRKELDTLFQINEATIYPEKDKIAKVIKQKFLSNNYSSKSVSLEDEVNTYFNRINYELKIISNSNQDNKKTLRVLRKEEKDIISYINACKINKEFSNDKSDEIIKNIEDNFKLLKLKYKENIEYGN